jgi:NitT/TauT family transport system substrate-binding protein
LNWFPEAEHGGYFAAEVHGGFAAAGVKVKILPGGPNSPVVQQVASGKIDFGVTNADRVLLGRAQEADVVAVMSPLQTSPRSIMVHEKSGIRSFDALKNVTLAMSGGATWAQFLQKKLPLDGVRIVPSPGGSVVQFLREEKFAQQAYVFSEPFVAEKAGGDPYNLMVSDLGFNPYTSVLICRRETIEKHPELVRKMVEASIEGWQKYLSAPDKTNRHIHKINHEMDLGILAFGAKALRPLCVNDEVSEEQLGRMTLARWKTLVEQLEDVEAIDKGRVDASKAFTAQFLPDVESR